MKFCAASATRRRDLMRKVRSGVNEATFADAYGSDCIAPTADIPLFARRCAAAAAIAEGARKIGQSRSNHDKVLVFGTFHLLMRAAWSGGISLACSVVLLAGR